MYSQVYAQPHTDKHTSASGANIKQSVIHPLLFSVQVYVATFAISAYASTYHRAGSKPFNPVLGETYECDRPDKNFRFIAEQVEVTQSTAHMIYSWGKTLASEERLLFTSLLLHECMKRLKSWLRLTGSSLANEKCCTRRSMHSSATLFKCWFVTIKLIVALWSGSLVSVRPLGKNSALFLY